MVAIVDVKKGLITVDTITQSFQYHPEFENVPPVDISGSPLAKIDASRYEDCGDTILAADDLGKMVEISGFGVSNRPNLNNLTEDNFTPIPTWKQLAKLAAFKVVQVACGFDHALVKTDTGDVLSWGQNKWGQLGHGDTVDRDAPRLVNRLRGKPIAKLTAGIRYVLSPQVGCSSYPS